MSPAAKNKPKSKRKSMFHGLLPQRVPWAPPRMPQWQDIEQLLPANPMSGRPEDLLAFVAGMPKLGATVFHGTPHRFAPTPKNPLGEFDMSKMSTGEGGQAYGYGTYVAENPKVAEQYRIGGGLPERGPLYKVDLPDEKIGQMLDWDAPLSQQPAAVQELAKGIKSLEAQRAFFGREPTGRALYTALAGAMHQRSKEASEILRRAGVRGIRYYDQGSRAAAGNRTRNFVLFNPAEDATIIGMEP